LHVAIAALQWQGGWGRGGRKDAATNDFCHAVRIPAYPGGVVPR
jgi:hypothetical protein